MKAPEGACARDLRILLHRRGALCSRALASGCCQAWPLAHCGSAGLGPCPSDSGRGLACLEQRLFVPSTTCTRDRRDVEVITLIIAQSADNPTSTKTAITVGETPTSASQSSRTDGPARLSPNPRLPPRFSRPGASAPGGHAHSWGPTRPHTQEHLLVARVAGWWAFSHPAKNKKGQKIGSGTQKCARESEVTKGVGSARQAAALVFLSRFSRVPQGP